MNSSSSLLSSFRASSLFHCRLLAQSSELLRLPYLSAVSFPILNVIVFVFIVAFLLIFFLGCLSPLVVLILFLTFLLLRSIRTVREQWFVARFRSYELCISVVGVVTRLR